MEGEEGFGTLERKPSEDRGRDKHAMKPPEIRGDKEGFCLESSERARCCRKMDNGF